MFNIIQFIEKQFNAIGVLDISSNTHNPLHANTLHWDYMNG